MKFWLKRCNRKDFRRKLLSNLELNSAACRQSWHVWLLQLNKFLLCPALLFAVVSQYIGAIYPADHCSTCMHSLNWISTDKHVRFASRQQESADALFTMANQTITTTPAQFRGKSTRHGFSPQLCFFCPRPLRRLPCNALVTKNCKTN